MNNPQAQKFGIFMKKGINWVFVVGNSVHMQIILQEYFHLVVKGAVSKMLLPTFLPAYNLDRKMQNVQYLFDIHILSN